MIYMTQGFAFHEQPRCPLCQNNLVSGCWDTRGGVAFCHTCAETAPIGIPVPRTNSSPNPLISLISWFHRNRVGKRWTNIAGISFYCPHPLATRQAAAHLDPWFGEPPAHPSLVDALANEPGAFDPYAPHPTDCGCNRCQET